jgi:hypothetical protein
MRHNLWPATFSQAWIHTTLWELASQDIYDETYGYIICKFFLAKDSTIKTHCSILNTPLTQTGSETIRAQLACVYKR